MIQMKIKKTIIKILIIIKIKYQKIQIIQMMRMKIKIKKTIIKISIVLKMHYKKK